MGHTRREILVRSAHCAVLAALVAFGGGGFGVGCGGAPASNCSVDLTTAQASLRSSLRYSPVSPHDDRVCSGCQFFTSASDACGECQILDGPVDAAGHCESWSARA